MSKQALSDAARRPVSRGIHAVHPLRLLLFGRPIDTAHQEHTRLPRFLALPVFSSDAISSVAYATQQILLALGAAGLYTMANKALYTELTMGITLSIVLLLIIVVISYWQTIFAYPSGGGSYIVSKDNLGIRAGLIAGAALLIDYVLTVAVSIASGVQNLLATPIMAGLSGQIVPVCLFFIALLTLANLRGLKESGTLFAIPTYTFIFMALLMIACGVSGIFFGIPHLYPQALPGDFPEAAQKTGETLTSVGLILVVLKAFANGCSAMTGVEAISNGVPAFRKPESRNAATTLLWMAVILGTIFLGISWLSSRLHVLYWEHGRVMAQPVIDQLSGAIFGKTGSPLRVTLYYLMQLSTTAILVLAANTSFADFPRLASIMARDRFLPRQLANLGDKLVYSNGIVLLGVCAMLLIVQFHGKVDLLIPLYAVGVFTAFTLSQSGMVRHWKKERKAGWRIKATINGFGAICTGIVLADIIFEKGREGAWIVVALMAILIALFTLISRHYAFVRRHLSMSDYQPPAVPRTNTVIVLIPSLHRGVMSALHYGRSLSPDCRAIHIEMDPTTTPDLISEWEKYVGEEIPLVILRSPYRSLIGPLLAYLDEVQRERQNHTVTVIVPEFVSGRWWHSLLHNANGLLVKYYLLNRPGIILSNVRYFLTDSHDSSDRRNAQNEMKIS